MNERGVGFEFQGPRQVEIEVPLSCHCQVMAVLDAKMKNFSRTSLHDLRRKLILAAFLLPFHYCSHFGLHLAGGDRTTRDPGTAQCLEAVGPKHTNDRSSGPKLHNVGDF